MFILFVVFSIMVVSVIVKSSGKVADSESTGSYDSKYEVYKKHNDWHYNRRGRLTDYNENDR